MGTAVCPARGSAPTPHTVINLERHVRTASERPGQHGGLRIFPWTWASYQRHPGAASALVAGGRPSSIMSGDLRRYGWPAQAEAEDGGIRIHTAGINGHAAYPEIARNAIGQLLILLRELGAQGPLARLADAVGTQYYGEGLGIQSQDKASGPLTCNLGILRVKDGELFATLDIRYPLLVHGFGT